MQTIFIFIFYKIDLKIINIKSIITEYESNLITKLIE